MMREMNVRELRARLDELVAEGLDPEASVTVRFHDVDSDCYVGGVLHLDAETGCADDEGLVICSSNDPEDFEKTDPDVPVRSLRLVT